PLFHSSQIGLWIAAKAPLLTPGFLTLLQLLTQVAPRLQVPGAQVLGSHGAMTRYRRGDQTHRTAQHQAGSADFATAGTPLVIAIRPEILLQVVVGAGKLRTAIAMEQPRPITGADLEEMVCGRPHLRVCPQVAAHTGQVGEQTLIGPAHYKAGLLERIGQ